MINTELNPLEFEVHLREPVRLKLRKRKQMNDIIEDCSDPTLVETIDISWFEGFRAWSSTPYAEVCEDEFLIRLNLGDPHLYNGIFLACLSPENLDEKIEESIAYFKKWGLPMRWWVGPTSEPTDLGKHLEARGLVHTGAMPGMAIELDSINQNMEWPQGLIVKQVQDD